MRAQRNAVLALWITAISAFAAAGARWASARESEADVRTPEGLRIVPEAKTPAVADLTPVAITIVERDVFRLDRRPAPVPFALSTATLDPTVTGEVDLTGEPLFAPLLSLAGIVGGPPWEAILEGVPERETGVVVRQGDVLGELRIRYVGPDSVVVAGADTTWTLTLKREWHP